MKKSRKSEREFAVAPGHWRHDAANVFVLKTLDRFVYRYELVRRLPTLLEVLEKTELVRPSLIRWVQNAKPFESLGFLEQQIMLSHLYSGWGERPPATTSRALGDEFGDYSEAFPPMIFDLRAGKSTVSKLFVEWFLEQKQKAGLGLLKKGKKGKGVSRNSTQNYKPPAWEFLAWLEHPTHFKPITSDHASNRRKRMLEEALQTLPLVIQGLKEIKTEAKKHARYYCKFPE